MRPCTLTKLFPPLPTVQIFTFYKAQGKKVGTSLVEDDKIELAKTLMARRSPDLCPQSFNRSVLYVPAGIYSCCTDPRSASAPACCSCLAAFRPALSAPLAPLPVLRIQR